MLREQSPFWWFTRIFILFFPDKLLCFFMFCFFFKGRNMDFIDYIFERFLAFEAGLGCLEIDAKILISHQKSVMWNTKILSVHRLLGMLESSVGGCRSRRFDFSEQRSEICFLVDLSDGIQWLGAKFGGTSIRTDYIYNLHVIYVIYMVYIIWGHI